MDLEKNISFFEQKGNVFQLGISKSHSKTNSIELPLLAFSIGNPDPEAPTLGLFGGVHGLERIGAQVVLSLMNSFRELYAWDEVTRKTLEKIRIVFFPMINPIGMMQIQRSNPNGVDLMRNSPTESTEKVSWLVGGQKISNRLPWFRGNPEKMEVEAQAVLIFCKDQFFKSKAVISVDFHSGFGIQDQLWFPYAKSKKPFPNLAQANAMIERLDQTLPHHFYRIEPQAQNYTTHGDLWDYIYDQFQIENPKGIFLPLALEMGSWLWVRKNPLQIFSSLGPFNPMKPHRQKRILRRHLTLFDFLIRSTVNHTDWSDLNPHSQEHFHRTALARWYQQEHT